MRGALTSPQDLGPALLFSAITFVVILFLRGSTVGGMSLAAMMLPSALAMPIVSMGMTIMTQFLTIDRESGALLRARAVPGGIVGYFVGKIVLVSGLAVIGVVVLLVPGLLTVRDVDLRSPLTLVWVLLLGLVAMLPIGAICGSLFPSPRSGSLIMLPFLGLMAISGIYYPIARFPHWLQEIAQVFPGYWLGLGMRSALLPDSMSAAEIGGSWRPLETVAVLVAWAMAGLVVAPFVLRRMARRESGSTMAVRQQRALRRVG